MHILVLQKKITNTSITKKTFIVKTWNKDSKKGLGITFKYRVLTKRTLTQLLFYPHFLGGRNHIGFSKILVQMEQNWNLTICNLVILLAVFNFGIIQYHFTLCIDG